MIKSEYIFVQREGKKKGRAVRGRGGKEAGVKVEVRACVVRRQCKWRLRTDQDCNMQSFCHFVTFTATGCKHSHGLQA